MGSINFKDALASAVDVSSPLPDGKYLAQVSNVELQASKNNKVQFKVNFKVLQGEHANRGCSTLITVSPESQAAMGIFFKEMETLGVPKAFFEQDNVDETDVLNLLNERKVQLYLTTDAAKAYNPDFTNVQRMDALPAGTAAVPTAAAPVAVAPAPVAAVPPVVAAPPVAVAAPPVAPPPVAPFQQ